MKGADKAEIEQDFHKAIDVAQKQSAKSFELGAAMSLARLWQCQRKTAEARSVRFNILILTKLCVVYVLFTYF